MSTGEGNRRALVTGITGQDGSFLAELLLEQGYEVIGVVRGDGLGAAEPVRGRVSLVRADLLDPDTLTSAVAEIQPHELYHLAAPSFVPATWEQPAQTVRAISEATATLLEAVRDSSRHTRVFVAVSSAIFGATTDSPQREDTPCRPESPYAAAKLTAHQLVGQLRAHDGLHACSGILYNHESERRPEHFVSRKITRGAAAVKLGLADQLMLGDLQAVRDWSFAGDVVRGIRQILQHDEPDDYILASGQPHTVAELADIAFARVNLNPADYIRVDPDFVREPESTPLIGDASRARERLGWRPTLSFEQLIQHMVDADVRALQAGG